MVSVIWYVPDHTELCGVRAISNSILELLMATRLQYIKAKNVNDNHNRRKDQHR